MHHTTLYKNKQILCKKLNKEHKRIQVCKMEHIKGKLKNVLIGSYKQVFKSVFKEVT